MYTCFLLSHFHRMLWSPNSKHRIQNIPQQGGESGLSRPAEPRQGRGELSWCVCSKAAISEGVDLDMWTRHFVILHAPAHSLLLAEICIAFFFLSHWSWILTTVSFQKTYHFLPGIFSFFVWKYYDIWHTKQHCQQNKSAVAMLPCVVCRFEFLSKKHLKMHMQNEHNAS